LFIGSRNFPYQPAGGAAAVAAPAAPDSLHTIELGHRIEVADDGAQFRQALGRQVRLSLHHVVVRGHADVEAGLFSFGVLLGHFASLLGSLELLVGVLDREPGVGHLGRDRQFLRLNLRHRLLEL
jgi:hypothetical protein